MKYLLYRKDSLITPNLTVAHRCLIVRVQGHDTTQSATQSYSELCHKLHLSIFCIASLITFHIIRSLWASVTPLCLSASTF